MLTTPDKIKIQKTLLLDYVQGTPWAILPDRLDVIHQILYNHYNHKVIDLASIEATIGKELNNTFEVRNKNGNAIIPIYGVIAKRLNMIQHISGGASTEVIKGAIEAALEDEAVKAIILDIDSPGGAVDGVKELADFIFESRGKKPITAFIDGTGASAAYWIASAADEVVAYDTSMVGSISVVMTHYDYSQRDAQDGVKRTFITTGHYKRLANDAEPLNKEAKDYLQSIADDYHTIFVDSVARNRGITIEDAIKISDGKLYIGKKALNAGLIDRIGRFKSVLISGSSIPIAATNITTSVVNATTTILAMEAFAHNSTVADSEPEWGSVDKTKLPKAAHARQGEKKSDWGYPHHHIVGGKTLNEDGVYTDGTMYLHKGGLSAAIAAANGARSGQKASPDIIAHLEAHRKALGLDKKEDKQQTQTTKEVIMDLQELKETYPELITALTTEVQAAFASALQSSNAENQKLKTEIEMVDKVNKELSKNLMILEENKVAALAAEIKKDILAASDIPENLHAKVSGMVDYRAYMADGQEFVKGSEAVTKFTEVFAAEVKDWEAKLPKAGSVLGAGEPKKDVVPSAVDKELIDRVLKM